MESNEEKLFIEHQRFIEMSCAGGGLAGSGRGWCAIETFIYQKLLKGLSVRVGLPVIPDDGAQAERGCDEQMHNAHYQR